MLKIYKILFLSALPLCLAQFSIQGPSDGNRQAQGLKYSTDKGIEYTDKSASLGAGDFTIQGATDGNSNFQIQGASDANTDFQIQGPTHGGAKTYLQDGQQSNQGAVYSGPVYQGAVRQGAVRDGAVYQGAIKQGAVYEGSRALQYQDPSGLRVNWKSYGRDRQNSHPQEVAAPQQAPLPRRRQPARQQNHQRGPALAPAQAQAPARQVQPNYTPFSNAPTQIKQILEYQAQIPYLNSIPEPFRYDAESAARAQAEQFRAEYPKQVQQAVRERQQAPAQRPDEGQQYQSRGQYRSKYRAESRQKRQAYPQQQQQQQQNQQADLSQYRRISQPPVEPQPRYSTNLPSQITSLLKYQAQIPYDNTANQINYRLDKPYVPQPVQPQQQQQLQQQQYAPQPQAQPAQPEYVPQYQGNPGYGQDQTQAQGQYYGQQQAQGQYYGQGAAPTRPVTEQQY